MSKFVLGEAQRLITNRKQDLERLMHALASAEATPESVSSTLTEADIRQEWRAKREHELLENLPTLTRDSTK